MRTIRLLLVFILLSLFVFCYSTQQNLPQALVVKLQAKQMDLSKVSIIYHEEDYWVIEYNGEVVIVVEVD